MKGSAVYYEGDGTFSLGACEVTAPGRDEVRIRIAYCGICGTDVHIAHGAMKHRVRPPQVIGHEMSGIVDAVGEEVEGFEAGDKVVVRPLDTRGETPEDRGLGHISRNLRFLGIDSPGAFQAYWTVPAFTLHKLPPAVELRLAALAEPLAVATHDVRLGHVKPGETSVVIGGGPIGLLVGLVAQHEGAHVILSEPNPHRLALAREFGFTVVDPSAEDLPLAVEELTLGYGADVVFEVSGSAAGAQAMTQLLGLRGRIVVVAIFPEPTPISLYDMFWKELLLQAARVYEPEDYEQAISLIAARALPVERLVTSVEPLRRLPAVFRELSQRTTDVKILVDCESDI